MFEHLQTQQDIGFILLTPEPVLILLILILGPMKVLPPSLVVGREVLVGVLGSITHCILNNGKVVTVIMVEVLASLILVSMKYGLANEST